jgi:pSer/pThr/pTyr-binding forkhead associated (FHA) protein
LYIAQQFEEQFELLLTIEDQKGRRQCPLERDVYSIGSHRDCDIRLCSQFVSKHHAILVRNPPGDVSYYRISDGDLEGNPSANGLLINGRKRHSYDLQDKDEIVFGPQVRLIYYVVKKLAD